MPESGSPPGGAYALAAAGLARRSHVSLQVADLERALAFYREVFGMQTVMERDLSGPEFEAVTATPGARSKLVRGLIAGNAVVQLFWHSWREPAAEPPPELVAAAHRVLAHCPGPHLYARVDGVRSGDTFLLMEVELIDPQLYLEDCPDGTQRFARAVRELAAGR